MVRSGCGALGLPSQYRSAGARQLAQTTAIFEPAAPAGPATPAGPVPVLLGPLAGAGAGGGSQTVVVDGYSGLARAINSSTAAPLCDSAAAAGGGRCLHNPVLRTAANEIVLTLSLGGGGAWATRGDIGAAVSLSGNASVASTRRRGERLQQVQRGWARRAAGATAAPKRLAMGCAQCVGARLPLPARPAAVPASCDC